MPGTTKASKKRQAPSQAGPKSKKIQLEKPVKPEKRRTRPITAPIAAEPEDSDSLEDLDDLDAKHGDEWLDDNDDNDRGNDQGVMDEDSPPDSGFLKPKDPNGELRISAFRTRYVYHLQQLPGNPIKHKKLSNLNGEPQNPTLPSSQTPKESGLWRGRKIFSPKNGRNMLPN